MPPTSSSGSMTVVTVDQVAPTWVTTPTSSPVEVMTQSFTSTPWTEPLLMVRVDSQLVVESDSTVAAS